ncbi:glycosyltransferase family 2 protein [Aureimonas sp. AU4]|uniref:glycosyltransferase family 2 protein n=1 Tax=Aureimonas sp. AU4 TaxID=1638163 RepID=UPI000780C9CF|nr:galactosyltransferase-related protein [Aureimonas sp. AU4]
MAVSVLTLLRGRHAHLRNLLKGLAQQTRRPDEVVVCWMGEEPARDLPDLGPVPVRHVRVDGDPMPLAAARNRAADAARGETLVFLDVDCIPSATLVERYEAEMHGRDALLLGEVLYLPAGAVGQGAIDYARLDGLGRVHPAKPPIPVEGVREERDHGELWGLSFALRRARYLALGGMDERFTGYGAEETDFAARLGEAGVPVFWTAGARAYHQHHPVHVPPLHQFDAILANARRFRAKHGRWCMDYWLGQFRDAAFVRWSPEAGAIEVLRRPSEAEVTASRRGGEQLFS